MRLLMTRRALTSLLFPVLAMASVLVSAQTSLSDYTQQQTQFLPVDEAYQLNLIADGEQRLLLQWEIAPDYYLYRHAFAATASSAEGSLTVTMSLPNGLAKTDEFFGDVEVYYGAVDAQLDVTGVAELVEIGVTYQGCADAGLCYPPKQRRFCGTRNRARYKPGHSVALTHCRRHQQTTNHPSWAYSQPSHSLCSGASF